MITFNITVKHVSELPHESYPHVDTKYRSTWYNNQWYNTLPFFPKTYNYIFNSVIMPDKNSIIVAVDSNTLLVGIHEDSKCFKEEAELLDEKIYMSNKLLWGTKIDDLEWKNDPRNVYRFKVKYLKWDEWDKPINKLIKINHLNKEIPKLLSSTYRMYKCIGDRLVYYYFD